MTPEGLSAWEERLRSWEADIAERATRLDEQAGVATSLPGAPVEAVLLHLLEDRRVGGLDADQLAAGLGLERELVRSVLAGERPALALTEVRAVCESLHASPFDLWPPGDARTVLVSYPPEAWPRYIEPLDDLYDVGVGDFVARRIGQQADELVALARQDGHLAPVTSVVVTPYRQIGVIAVDEVSGRVSPVLDEHAPAQAGVDYYFTFTQLRRPMEMELQGALPIVPPPGVDAPPELAEVADRVRRWTPAMAMVRFTDTASGTEHWLGLDPTTGSWHTWDDPALDYPGPRREILDPDRHLDPGELTGRTSPLTLVEDRNVLSDPITLDIS
jgi:hypothetical protein